MALGGSKLVFIWTFNQERLGEPVKDMVGSSTRLLLIRPSSVTLLDFWEGKRQNRDNKRKFDGPISEVGGKRRLSRESTKGKRKCCSFC